MQRKPRQRVPHAGLFLVVDEELFGPDDGGQRPTAAMTLVPATAPPQRVQRLVDRCASDPRFRVTPPGEFTEPAFRSDHHILSYVLGEVGVPNHAERNADDDGVLAAEEPLEPLRCRRTGRLLVQRLLHAHTTPAPPDP